MKRCRSKYLIGLLALAMSALTACHNAEGSYQSQLETSQTLYSNNIRKLMRSESPLRNPVIVVHGLVGSKLLNQDNGRVLWGEFSPRMFEDDFLTELARPISPDLPLNRLKDNVKAIEMMRTAQVDILNISFELPGYDGLLDILRRGGYVFEGDVMPEDKHYYSMFTFCYDWRSDIPEIAAELHQFILTKRRYLQKKYEELYGIKDYDVQFDIIGHSMGGLVSRYYLRFGDQPMTENDPPRLDWRGSRYVDKLIMIGTPNGGYLDTCLELINGLKIVPVAPLIPPAFIGTFPTFYQMMPRAAAGAVIDEKGRKVDMFDPEVWIANQWGLADPGQDKYLEKLMPKVKSPKRRRQIALEHLRKSLSRARQFVEIMAVESIPPEDVELYIYAGDAIPTNVLAQVKNKKIKVIAQDAGDGKVSCSSVRFDQSLTDDSPFIWSPEQWDAVYYVGAAHMGITKSRMMGDNLIGNLLIGSSRKNHHRGIRLKKQLDEFLVKVKSSNP
ncbi:MAG: hypothetical protein MST10_03895 [Lentisphaeria bacterium]|nr:hypothetical protein [Lentisphaeria bacterium]